MTPRIARPALVALSVLALLPALPLRAQQAAEKTIDPAEKAALAKIGLEDEPIHDLEERAAAHKKRRDTNPVAARIARYAAAAAETIEDKEPERGMALLERLDMDRLNPQERAQVYQVRAFVAYELGDIDAAIENFEKVLEQEVMDLEDEDRMRFAIAQLRASEQDWPGAIRALHTWSEYAVKREPLAYYLMAIAQYQIENIDQAIAYGEKALAATDDPKESWLQLLAALYVEKENYKAAQPVLEDLLVRFPKKGYWVQLSLIYGALENYQRSLAVQQLAYTQGLLTEDEELRRLARSYLYSNLPYQAAKVLEKGLADGAVEPTVEAYELLANSWIAAREYEKSLPALQKAADLSDTGDLYVRLGQVRMQREEWDQAAEMFRQALEKGDLKDSGQALLLLGISYYNAEQVGQARSYFARALQHDKSRAEAERWIKHIDEAESPEGELGANPTT